jgi:hypothetical protein
MGTGVKAAIDLNILSRPISHCATMSITHAIYEPQLTIHSSRDGSLKVTSQSFLVSGIVELATSLVCH